MARSTRLVMNMARSTRLVMLISMARSNRLVILIKDILYTLWGRKRFLLPLRTLRRI